MKLTRLSPANALSLAALAAAAVALQSQEKLGQVSTLGPDQREILRHMSIVYLDDGQGGQAKTIRVEGVNVQVVNGLGATNGYPPDPNATDPALVQVNGLGNLIVGYNELGNFNGDDRRGSHNIVGGRMSSYPSFGGILGGESNTVSGQLCSAIGGYAGIAGKFRSVIVGGSDNMALGTSSVVVGGANNDALAEQSLVVGGFANAASTSRSVTVGGSTNDSKGFASVVVGGQRNQTRDLFGVVSGGQDRTALGPYDWVAGSLFEDN